MINILRPQNILRQHFDTSQAQSILFDTGDYISAWE